VLKSIKNQRRKKVKISIKLRIMDLPHRKKQKYLLIRDLSKVTGHRERKPLQ